MGRKLAHVDCFCWTSLLGQSEVQGGLMIRALLLTGLILSGCGPAGSLAVVDGSTFQVPDDSQGGADGSVELKMPSEAHDDTLDVGSWNLEWFGAPDFGPTDETLQQANVKKVLGQIDLDLVGLVEVVSPEAFSSLLTDLPAYEGLLVTDARVTDGAAFYYAGEQKMALLFKRRFTMRAARVVLTDSSFAFAGRPPLEVTLTFDEAGAPRELVVLVVHFKAMANLDGYTRRTTAALALKQQLDHGYPGRMVLVVGDFNDDLDHSTYHGQASPFAPLLSDPAYRFTTESLSVAGVSTTVKFRSTIDHHLVTAELGHRFVNGSAHVLHPEPVIPDYVRSTSDHYPVVTNYDLR